MILQKKIFHGRILIFDLSEDHQTTAVFPNRSALSWRTNI